MHRFRRGVVLELSVLSWYISELVKLLSRSCIIMVFILVLNLLLLFHGLFCTIAVILLLFFYSLIFFLVRVSHWTILPVPFFLFRVAVLILKFSVLVHN